MSKVGLKAIVLRREIVNSRGKRLDVKKFGWQRCYMMLQNDHLKIWNAGGILLDDTDALDELENDLNPIDSIYLRMVHVQKIADRNCICLHFTQGMERIILSPEYDDDGRTLESWSSLFQRAIRESVLMDQYKTSVFLHTYRADDILSFAHKSPKGVFEESFTIEYKWPGNLKYERCTLSIKMKPGWKDSRVVSKRCIVLSKEEGPFKKMFAAISPLTSFHILSKEEGTVILEGEGRYQLNDPNVAPIVERILVKPLQIDELKRFLLFLRDSFEVILPRPNIFDEPLESIISFQSIAVENTEDKPSKTSNQESLANLVQSKPWNQLEWNDLYAYYKLKNYKNADLSPIDFTLKFKSFGFCLKTICGAVVNTAELQKLQSMTEEEAKDALASMYWNHLALNHVK